MALCSQSCLSCGTKNEKIEHLHQTFQPISVILIGIIDFFATIYTTFIYLKLG